MRNPTKHSLLCLPQTRPRIVRNQFSHTAPAPNLKMKSYHPHFHVSPDTAETVNPGALGLDQACVNDHPWAPFREKKGMGFGAAACAGRNSGEGCFYVSESRFKWGRFLPRDTGLPWWLWWERICLKCTKPRFDAWTGKIPWRREWQPTPVSLPGKSHGQRSLGWLQSTGSQRVRHNWATNISSLGNKPTHVSRKNSERLTGPKFIKEH